MNLKTRYESSRTEIVDIACEKLFQSFSKMETLIYSHPDLEYEALTDTVELNYPHEEIDKLEEEIRDEYSRFRVFAESASASEKLSPETFIDSDEDFEHWIKEFQEAWHEARNTYIGADK